MRRGVGVALRVAAAAIALAVVALLVGSAHKIGAHCSSNGGANDEYCTIYKAAVLRAVALGEFLDEHDGAVTAVATAFIAAFTIVLAIIARRQARYTRIVERAYISAKPAGIEPSHVDRGDRVHALVTLHNSGHLPARNVSWSINIGTFEGTEPPKVTVRRMNNVLAPGSEIQISSKIMLSNRTPNNTFVWGTVIYDDGFGIRRYTRFCHYYRTKGYVGSETAYEIPASDARSWSAGNDAN